MKHALFCLSLVALTGCSSTITFRESNEFTANQMGMRSNFVTWRVVEDATAECMRLGSEAGALACAIMGKHNCVIITSKNTSHEILGHETRHCFEGNFHK